MAVAVIFPAVVRRAHRHGVRGRYRQRSLFHRYRVVVRVRARRVRIREPVVRHAHVCDRARRRRRPEGLRPDEPVAVRILRPVRVRQRVSVVYLRVRRRRYLDLARQDDHRLMPEHRIVVRVRHHVVHRLARRVIRRRRAARLRVRVRVRAVALAVAHRRARDVRRHRDSVRRSVVLARVSRCVRRRRRRRDCQLAVHGGNIILICNIRRAARHRHVVDRYDYIVFANIRPLAGHGVIRNRHIGNVDLRSGNRLFIPRIDAGIRVACDNERLFLRVGCINCYILGQIRRGSGIIRTCPIVVQTAGRHALRRGVWIRSASRFICNRFGAKQGTVCAEAICHNRIDREAAAYPGNGVAFRHVIAAALEHKRVLILEARGISAGLGAGGARRGAFHREAGDARDNTGNAFLRPVIAERGACRSQRQRSFCRPDGVERQVAIRHGDRSAGRICGVCRGRGRIRAPTEEVEPVLRELVFVHAEARAHRLGRAIAAAAAKRSAIAVIGQRKERHHRVNLNFVVGDKPGERIAVAGILCRVERRSVVCYAGDFIAFRQRPAYRCVAAV